MERSADALDNPQDILLPVVAYTRDSQSRRFSSILTVDSGNDSELNKAWENRFKAESTSRIDVESPPEEILHPILEAIPILTTYF